MSTDTISTKDLLIFLHYVCEELNEAPAGFGVASMLHQEMKSLEDKVIITEKLYNELCNRDLRLAALEENGVDNWCGYSEAMKTYRDYKKEQDD